ncbi:hypothetical protein HMPREF0127_04807 [Bacteroides sp. 1_1_30]|nr:hypothetical protein HMPREF0127_04807 [Bacteroides sp. 1_1_30]KAB6164144.1 hypothetical protein GA393_21640 [Bacteroides xylanisolvens]CUN74313.1 Uncharacterised protein [Bacteroides xylanisolvens]
MRKYLFILMFVSIAQLFYGQEKYTIQGEFPDNSRLGNLNSLNIYALLIQCPKRIEMLFCRGGIIL